MIDRIFLEELPVKYNMAKIKCEKAEEYCSCTSCHYVVCLSHFG